MFLSRDELVEYDDDESLSCLLFVLDEILFTLLLLLLLPPLELCFPPSFSLSLSFDDDDEVRDEEVLLLDGSRFAAGAFELLE